MKEELEKIEFDLKMMNQTIQKKRNKKKKILILQYWGDRFRKEGNQKGILHLISIQKNIFLLLMIILELLGRQWIQRMEKYGKRPWMKKWKT
jgi:hypothetical protein